MGQGKCHLINKSMKKNLLGNNGQSLVEVTVALSLLTIVLTGVVTLAVSATGLMISSRMGTEATVIAQEGLEVLKGAPSNTCAGLDPGEKFLIDSEGLLDLDLIGAGQPVRGYTRIIETLDDNITGEDSTDLILAQVTVTWKNRGQPIGEIVLKQIISKR